MKHFSPNDYSQITSTLAWLYQYSLMTDMESTKYEFYTHDQLPRIKPAFIYHYLEKVVPKRLFELDPTIAKLVSHAVNLHLDSCCYFKQVPRQNILDNVTTLVRQAMQKELQYRQKGYITFFHAQSTGFAIIEQAYYLLTSRSFLFDKGCYFIDGADALFKAIDDLNMLENRDHDLEIIRRIIPVNYSLFGNFGRLNEPESTLAILISNENIVVKPTSLIKYITSDPAQAAIIQHLLDYDAKQRSQDYLPGQLILIAIPIDLLDNFVYNSLSFGRLPSFRGETNIPVSDFLTDYLSPLKQDFLKYNRAQARVVDLCFTDYGKQKGVILENLNLIPDAEKLYIDRELRRL